MKLIVSMILTLMVMGGELSSQSEVRIPSVTIAIECPSELPEAVRQAHEGMCLHATSDGRMFLYIEQDNGSRLSILDVTEPGSIRAVAVVPNVAPATFDFVQEVGDSEELIRYRDNSSLALLNLRKYKHPAVRTTSQVVDPKAIKVLGVNDFLSAA